MLPPDTDLALVVRTDFTDQSAWDAIRAGIVKPVGPFGFRASVEFVDDRESDGATAEQLVALFSPAARSFVIIAEFESLAAARAWSAQDPYVLEGVFGEVEIKPVLQVAP